MKGSFIKNDTDEANSTAIRQLHRSYTAYWPNRCCISCLSESLKQETSAGKCNRHQNAAEKYFKNFTDSFYSASWLRCGPAVL